jgi:hypothetical protein
LLQETSQFNSNDVLVDIGREIPAGSGREMNLQGDLKTIYDSANKTQKELGIFPLCIARGTIEWEFKQTIVRSPLVLTPCKASVNKINKTIQIIEDPDAVFVNPFVINHLQRNFDLILPKGLLSLDEVAGHLIASGFEKVETETEHLDNFHHHRFEIIKELDELMKCDVSTNVSQLLGDECSAQPTNLDLGNGLLFPADVDQLDVFDCLDQGNTVVQGPPGTGKSQVLTNVLGKILLSNKSSIVISEKRVALEVIRKKLDQFGLGHLCFIASSETISRDVMNELKESWTLLEKQSSKPSTNLCLSEQYIDQLQLQLDLLNRSSLIGGISYKEFHSISEKYDLENSVYHSDLPDMKDWMTYRNTVKELFSSDLSFYASGIAPGVLQQDNFRQFDKSVRNWLKELARMKKIFVLETYADLHEAMKKAALCQHYANEAFRKHEKILTQGSKEQQRFIKLRKKFLQLQIVHASLEPEKNNWKTEPSLSQTEGLLTLLQNTSFFGKRKFKKEWGKVAAISDSNAGDALNKWKLYLSNSNAISQLKIDFCEIGIDNVENELEFVYQQIRHFDEETRSLWQEIPVSDRQIYADENSSLNQLHTHFKTSFRWVEHVRTELFLTEVIEHFDELLQVHADIRQLDEATLRNIKNYKDFASMEADVCKSNFTRFTLQFPQFSQFSLSQLIDKCHRIISEQDREAELVAQEIIRKQHDRFAHYHRILRTPAGKLSDAEKELKAVLKKGKSILVKEFAKTRNFPSMRELFASEARLWIQLLKPVWLSNPAQIAKCFPMQQGMFDLAIFDEASQIPLQNALGTVQRSKSILVAGDQQQMGPSSYFKAQTGEITDLLHQSGFYWKNAGLKHHYRSENPELIRFSNKHFYNNELIAFPSFQSIVNPCTLHFIDNGVFEERTNLKEAKSVAEFIEEQLKSDLHLGIVAFSESQLAAIHAHLSIKAKEKLEILIEEDRAFFKALENVQGEECDQLIISLGYARDTEGEFHMRFGPLNTKNGPKRLNVLLTRAKKKIDFFASVTGNDFKISANEGVDLLRLYLLHAENNAQNNLRISFPLGLDPKINGNQLLFNELYSSITSAHEMVTLFRVLEGRGWEIQLR